MTDLAKPSIFSDLAVSWRVIVALVLRETKTRFGKRRIGYFWAVLEPVLYVVIYIGLRNALRSTVPFGESVVLFMLSGLLIFRLFFTVSSRAMSAINVNKPLLAYPPVKPVDVIVSRLILETLTMYVVFMLFFVFIALQSGASIILNHEQFFAAIVATTLLASGIGTFNAVVSMLFQNWDRIFRILTIPLFMTSGVFYVPKSMPMAAQEFVQWNPVLHCVEWLRTGVYLSYDPMLSKSYVLGFGFFSLVAGLALERIYRYRLLNS